MNILLSKKVIISLSVVVLVGALGYFVFGREKQLEYQTVLVQRGDIIQEVSVTGRVKAAESVELAFEQSGRLDSVFVHVGDVVSAGQLLLALDDDELVAELAQAQANAEAATAELAELQRGTRPEEIAAAETKLKNAKASAQADLDDVYSDALTAMKKAVTEAKNSLFVLTDIQFAHFLGSDFESLMVSDAKAKAVLSLLGRDNAGRSDTQVLGSLSGGVFGEAHSLLVSQREEIDTSLGNVLTALNDVKAALKGIPVTGKLTSTERINLAAEEAAVDAELVNISAKQQAIAVQGAANTSAVEAAEDDLILKQAGATPEQLATQEAKVRAAEAQVQAIAAKLSKTRLSSPIAGVVTMQEGKRGEIISANEVVVSIISEADLEIETFIPEVDIPKVNIGDKARVTLDAYGSDVGFIAHVVEIDPAETIIEGVPTYKVVLHFTEDDERVRSGMTANVDILTEQKEDILSIPQRAVITKDGEKVVRVLRGGGIVVETAVELGVRGSDGNIEISQGLEEGDVVILFVID